MDPSLLKVIAAELNDELSGGVVSKIHQPDERTLILRIFIRGRDLKLLVSAHHSLPRLHLTDRSYPNPPSRFCNFLKSFFSLSVMTFFRAAFSLANSSPSTRLE